MDVELVTSSDKFSESNDDRRLIEIKIDGKDVISFLDGEKEDANLSRDFNGCYSIIDLMEQSYKAGKKGEDFNLVKRQIDDWE